MIDCDIPAVFRYTWPGKDETFCCAFHANGIIKVAQALGFHLQMILIDPDIDEKCSSEIE